MAGERILVIEDNVLNRKLVHDILEAQGYVVVEADTAEVGLAHARDVRPDLILMDIQLPGMDGIAATRLVRADPELRGMPIVAITASVAARSAEMATAGFDGIQTKPISVAGLLAEVRRVLQHAQVAVSPATAGGRSSIPVPPAAAGGGHVLVVDDTPANVRLLADVLAAQGYRVSTATGGAEALRAIDADRPDLMLLDVMMPGMSGYEVCRRLRAGEATRLLPVVLVTALDATEERVRGIEAGADDFLTKPVNQPELLARVRSLLRIHDLHETVQRQAAELAEWNRTLSDRVDAQLKELARLDRLKRFFSPQVREVLGRDDDALLRPHRRMVTVASIDLRGFTAFAETAEPEEVMGVLRDYHAEMGGLVTKWEGTLEYFAGDGIIVVFNDPVEVSNPEERAVRMAVAMRDAVEGLRTRWRRQGFELGAGFGIGSGYATAGVIGFEERWDYSVIGTVVNQAARLVGVATHGQVLVSQRVLAAVEALVEAEPVGELTLKGMQRPLSAFNVLRLLS